MTVDIDVAAGVDGVPSRAQFRRWLCLATDEFGVSDGEAALRIVDEPEGAALNTRWRGRQGATNVLSFPAGNMPDMPGVPRHLGDLVLCAPVLRREAQAQGKPELHHWAHLVVHGTLHLLGLDHEESGEAQRMEALERALLARLGIADPYAERKTGDEQDN
ncbi:MAG: rRNA maturation RNase YbeY [Gammaproteobacteria bacterium]|nr:rRNA maturation RNase YbeY [Gammaproteobacteria bacterium]